MISFPGESFKNTSALAFSLIIKEPFLNGHIPLGSTVASLKFAFESNSRNLILQGVFGVAFVSADT